MSESVGLEPADEIGDQGEERLAAVVRDRLEEERDETDDAVFMSSFIPRNLGEVYDPERDVDLVNAGRGDELIYSTLTGVPNAAPDTKEDTAVPSSAAVDDVEKSIEDAGSGDEPEEEDKNKPRGFRNEDKDAKKVCQAQQLLLMIRKGSRLSRRQSASSASTKCPRPRRRD